MRNFTWNRFPIKNLLIDSLLTPIVESTYLNRDMCTFESSQKDKSRWQSTDSSKAYRNTSAFKCAFYHSGFLTNLCLPWKQSLPWNFSRQDATRTQQLYYKFPMWCFFFNRWVKVRVRQSLQLLQWRDLLLLKREPRWLEADWLSLEICRLFMPFMTVETSSASRIPIGQ